MFDPCRGLVWSLDFGSAQRYAEFRRDMVYGDRLAHMDALVTVSALAEELPQD
jgi:hypothetical protein